MPRKRFTSEQVAFSVLQAENGSALDEVCRKTGVSQADCAIEVDGNSYSVPWRLIGERVRVAVTAEALRVSHGGREVAVHARQVGRRQRIVEAAHFAGVAGFGAKIVRAAPIEPVASDVVPALLRPLVEYEALIGGGF